MNETTEHFTQGSKSLLQDHGYGDFSSIWNASLGFVDEPNIGRGGRSDVGRLCLVDANNKELVFYVKRQVNYTSKTLSHPISGIPLTLKEFNSIATFKALDIACLDACYQGYRHHNGELQSILITPALEGYQDLDHYQPASIRESRRITRELAHLLAKLHKAGYRHGCLYPKHIFINPNDNEAPVRLIDLEKVVRSPFKQYHTLKDLTTLHRRVSTNKSCNLYFLLCYFHVDKHNAKIRQLIQKMDARRAKRPKS
jgi:serine/threonine protein kinase